MSNLAMSNVSGKDNSIVSSLDGLITAAEESQTFFGLEILVFKGEELIYERSSGKTKACLNGSRTYIDEELCRGKIFDLGSLTRSIFTAISIYQLCEEKLIDYNLKISRFIPSFGSLGKERMTIGHILTNTSGLTSPYNLIRSLHIGLGPLGEEITRRVAADKILKEITKVRIANLPGKKVEESSLGYLSLMYVLEQVSGMSLEKLFRKKIAHPFNLSSIDFIDWEQLRREKIHVDLDSVIPTRYCSWRKGYLHGLCSDELAWYLNGVSSHSGLFGSLNDVGRLGNILLGILKSSQVKQENKPENETFNLLGLKVLCSQSGSKWYGLDGDTGVSLWINPETENIFVVGSTDIQVAKTTLPNSSICKSVRELFQN